MRVSNYFRRFSVILTAAALASGAGGVSAYAEALSDTGAYAAYAEENAVSAAEAAEEKYTDEFSDNAAQESESADISNIPEDTENERPVKLYDPALEADLDTGDDLAGASSLNTSTWTKYSLTEAQLLALTRLCYQEQGSIAGAAAEASLMANLLELYHTDKYGTTGTSLYNYVRNGKWFANAAKFMDSGKLPSNSQDYINAVANVLINGKRTLPLYIDEHDCLSDIVSVTDTADDGTYISGKTVISNKFSSVYTFYTYPAKGSDPFGYTAGAIKKTGGKSPSVYTADTSYVDINPVTPVYRLYNRNSGEHFYTKSTEERKQLIKAGWRDENIAWYEPTDGDDVYRLYSKKSGDHFYTTSAKERDSLVKAGWNYEGIAWHSCTDESRQTPLYRLYNPHTRKAGSHHFTTSANERDSLVKAGWRYEGIGWYGAVKK